tara:strand:+ start:469 stop:1002 length:534 start_codon:yes stop_codon:yes gene_type:complete
MSGIINSAGSKSGIIGEMGLGLSNVTFFTILAKDTVQEGKIENWNDPTTPISNGGSVGKLVSESAGVFTLPSYGIWQINAVFNVYQHTGDNWFAVALWQSNGTPVEIVNSWGGIDGQNDEQINSLNIHHIINATGNTFEFRTRSVSGGSYVLGTTDWNAGIYNSTVTFMKLGNSSSS